MMQMTAADFDKDINKFNSYSALKKICDSLHDSCLELRDGGTRKKGRGTRLGLGLGIEKVAMFRLTNFGKNIISTYSQEN